MAARRHPLEKKVRRLRGRLSRIEMAQRVLQCLLAASATVLLLLVVQRLLVETLDVWLIAQVMAGVALGGGLLWAISRRPTLVSAAAAADEKMKLRERISSGLVMLHSEKRMEQAVVDDAVSHAGRLRVGDVFPYPFFRELRWLSAVVALIAAVYFFLPPMDLPARATEPAVKDKPLSTQVQKQTAEQLEQLKEQLAQRTEAKDPLEIGEIEKNLELMQRELELHKTTPLEALAKVSKLNDQLQEKRDTMNDKMKDFQDMQPPPNAKFTKEISKDLKAGRFKEAASKLEDLKQKAGSNEMTPQDKEQLAKEMKQMAEQMKANPEMAEALKKAAQSMQAGDMEQMMENLGMCQMSMAEMAEAMEQMKMLDSLCEGSEGLKEMIASSCLGQGQGQGQGEGGEGQWGKTDSLSRDWTAGEELNKGSGMGEAGRGMGGTARVAEDTYKLSPDKVAGEMQKGKILSMQRVEGEQIKGESNINFDEAVVEYKQVAEDTLEREPLPMEYKNLVRDYMDLIRPEVSAATAAEEAPSE